MSLKIKNGMKIGPYTVKQQLDNDKGGMSKVALAYLDDIPNIPIAVKIQSLDEKNKYEYKDRLVREVEILDKLRHPNIVRILPIPLTRSIEISAIANDIEGRPRYFTMEYIGEGSLEDEKILRQISRMSLMWRAELFYNLLITVDYLHSLGFAHCDLKPANILFKNKLNENISPNPILIDFGTYSKVKKLSIRPAGTPRYCPPELLIALNRPDMPIDHILPSKIDIWGLGALLYEIMTGKKLISGNTRKKVTTNVIEGEIIAMKDVDSNIPKSLDQILEVMTKQNPAERPSTTELIEAVERRISSIRPPRI